MVVAQLKEHGYVDRAWLGVQVQPVTAEIADSLGLKKAEGAIVAEPQADSPATKVGVVAGDVITAIDGTAVKDSRDLARKIGMMAPGSRIKLTVTRKGEAKTLDLTLAKMPDQTQAKKPKSKKMLRPAVHGSASTLRRPRTLAAPAPKVSQWLASTPMGRPASAASRPATSSWM